MKTLSELLYKAGTDAIHGNTSIGIADIHFSSREVTPHSLFVAIKGASADGHRFIDQAIDNGAVAIVCESFPEQTREGITYVRVQSSSLALAILANNFFDNPSEKIKLIGVTGTNGKTTTTTLLYRAVPRVGIPLRIDFYSQNLH
jgi:UDP-N-acetylmuramyl tripeptide synthase